MTFAAAPPPSPLSIVPPNGPETQYIAVRASSQVGNSTIVLANDLYHIRETVLVHVLEGDHISATGSSWLGAKPIPLNMAINGGPRTVQVQRAGALLRLPSAGPMLVTSDDPTIVGPEGLLTFQPGKITAKLVLVPRNVGSTAVTISDALGLASVRFAVTVSGKAHGVTVTPISPAKRSFSVFRRPTRGHGQYSIR